MEDVVVIEPEVEVEDRIDEFAISMFQHLGFEGRLPDDLVQVYNDYKRTKDRLSPGRLTAEGYATVVTLYGMLSNG